MISVRILNEAVKQSMNSFFKSNVNLIPNTSMLALENRNWSRDAMK